MQDRSASRRGNGGSRHTQALSLTHVESYWLDDDVSSHLVSSLSEGVISIGSAARMPAQPDALTSGSPELFSVLPRQALPSEIISPIAAA